jgi:ribonuclease P protein component
MLPRQRRLRSGADFKAAVRCGRHCSTRLLIVHVLADDSPGRAGVVVSRAVGKATVRNRVKRRIRAGLQRRSALPAGRIVVRASPAAARATFAELAGDLDRCLDRLAKSSP